MAWRRSPPWPLVVLGALLSACGDPGPGAPDARPDGSTVDAGDAAVPGDGALDATPEHCRDLEPGGRCVGTLLYVCHGEWLKTLDCAALGGRCEAGGERAGCLPGAGGTHRARGRVTRDLRAYSTQGLGALSQAPAAHLTAVILDATTGDALNFGITDEDGRFDIPYAASSGAVRLRVITLAFDAGHRLTVTDGQDAAYAVQGPPTNDASADVTLDLYVPEAADAGALHIFGLLQGHQTAAQLATGTPLPTLQAVWERGESIQCGTCFERYPPTLFALGDPQDTDEFDDCVLSHEFGHYLSFTASRDDTPGGAHDGSPMDPRQAWSEGLATWIGQTLLGESLYIDTQATGATVRDPEDMGWDADPAGPLDQPMSEYVVLEILWDLTDPVSGPLDPMARPAADVFDVLTGYLPSSAGLDRGVPEVDLVDFLDGWFCRGHGDRAGITALVVQDQGFPYDFDGPTACEKPGPRLRLDLTTRPGARPGAPLEVILRVVDPRGTDHARARLLLPPSWRGPPPAPIRLGALAPQEPRTVTWPRSPGADPAWIAAGVTVARGPGSVTHASRRLWRHPAPALGRDLRRVDLGGLLRFRIRDGVGDHP